MTRTKSRMLKIQCSGCGAILYGSKQSLRMAKGLLGLRCGCGQAYFTPAHAEDRELIENTTEREA